MVDAVNLHAGGCADRVVEALARMRDTALPAVSRMRAVDALAALVDKWLADTSVVEQERNRRTQDIITALCDYLRTPYPSEPQGQGREPQHRSSGSETTEKEPSFYTGEGETPPNNTTETPLRQHILSTIHQRVRWEPSSGGAHKNAARHLERGAVTPGPWSHLVFDFSGAEFRHTVNLSESYWGAGANFSGCSYRETANLSASVYAAAAHFTASTYYGKAIFRNSVYRAAVHMSGCDYRGQVHAQATVYEAEANLSENTYREGADWTRSTWRGHLNASGCTYRRAANFAECTWGCDVTLAGCTYEKDAVFMSTAFHGTAHMKGCTYRAGAYFSYSEFRGDTDFSGSVFRHDTEFVGCRWRGSADLSGCTLHHVSFEGSSHLRAITFRGTQFSSGRCVFDRSVYAGGIDFTGAAQATSTAQERAAGEPQVSFTDCFLNSHHENYFAHPVFTGSGLPAGSRYLTPEETEDLANRLAAYMSAAQTYHDAAEGPAKEALAARVRNLDNAIDQWAYALTNRASYSDW